MRINVWVFWVFFPTLNVAADFAFTKVQSDKLTNDLDLIITWKQIDRCEMIPTQKQLDWWLRIRNLLWAFIVWVSNIYRQKERKGERGELEEVHRGGQGSWPTHLMDYFIEGQDLALSRVCVCILVLFLDVMSLI